MKIAVVIGHPDPESYNHALAKAFIESAKEEGHEVRVLDLATAEFDPVLRFGYRKAQPEEPFVRESKEALLWAEHLAIFFPLWWTAEPALLKGWFDRVFLQGFAYRFEPDHEGPVHLLSHLTATLCCTSHQPAEISLSAREYPISRIADHIFGFTGVRAIQRLAVGGIGEPGDRETCLKFLETVRDAAKSL